MNKFEFKALNGEKWKPLIEFDGYFVSSYGRVWSNKQKCRYLETSTDKYGYHHVRLYVNGKRHDKLLHRLVAEKFVANPNRYKEVNHKDEDKSNNSAKNLEWCTRKYNILYGKAGKERYVNMGMTQRYSRNDLKAVECLDLKTGEVVQRFKSIAEATRSILAKNKSNGSQRSVRSNISNCCNNRKFVKSVFGYKWRFADV